MHSDDLDTTLLECPFDYAAVFDCFRNIKQGQDLPQLLKKRAELDKEEEATRRSIELLHELVLKGEKPLSHLRAKQDNLFRSIPIRRNANDAEIAHVRERQKSADIARELQTIMNMPRVLDLWPMSETVLGLSVLATYELKGTVYHLGTWSVYIGNFNPDGSERTIMEQGASDARCFRVRRAVETRRSIVHDSYPIYDRADGSFCFGSKLVGQINDYAMSGHIIDAVNAIIEGLCSISKTHDIWKIPEKFKVYKPEETR